VFRASASPDFQIEPWEDGCAFPVKAHAGAKREGLSICRGGWLKIEVAAAPENGKANKAIVTLLAKALDVRAGQIFLLSGGASPRKRFGIRSLSPETAYARFLVLPTTGK
jgi:uncharacterized protein YggU (UPF0235/DUF167 family)